MSDKKISFCVYDSNVLYIRMDSFLYSGVAEEISSVLSDFHSISGVILDVRKNIGGMTAYAAGRSRTTSLPLAKSSALSSNRISGIIPLPINSVPSSKRYPTEQIRNEPPRRRRFKNGVPVDPKVGEPIISARCVLLNIAVKSSAAEIVSREVKRITFPLNISCCPGFPNESLYS